MRKKGRKLWKAITVFMVTATAFGALQEFSVTSKADTTKASQENECSTMSEEEIKEIFTMSEEEEEEYAVEAAAVASDGKYVSSVDLSGSKYFPGILNQGSLGSCHSHAFLYTTVSFAINQSKGIASTQENCLNPLAAYTWTEMAAAEPTGLGDFELVTQLGVPTCGKWSIDYNKRNVFYTSDDIWLDALNHRVKEMKALPIFGEEDDVVTEPKDSSLNAMKEKLKENKLLAIATYFYSFQYSTIPSGNYKGQQIVTGCYGAEGGHVMVIVGYDDKIWVDINRDGIAQDSEKGAFKVANSHGKDSGNDGFIWVSYDAFNKKSQVPKVSDKLNGKTRISFSLGNDVRYAVLREKENSGCLCYVTVNTAARRQMKLVVTARNNVTGESKKYTFPVLINNISDNVSGLNIDPNGDYAWDGSTYATDANIVFDLDNVISDITPETLNNYTWSAIVSDSTEDSNSLTIKRLQIKSNGNVAYAAKLDAGGTKVNGNSHVFLLNNEKTLSGKSGVDVNGKKTEGVYENGVLTLGASWCYKLNSFQLQVNNSASEGGIEYRVYQNGAWTEWASDGELCGDNSSDTKFVQIRLTGKLSEKYDVCYKTIVYGGTWSGWAANGEKSGSSDRRVEGVKITLISKETLVDKLNEDKVFGNLDYGTCNETLTGSSGKDHDGKDTSAVYHGKILKLGATWDYGLKWFKLNVKDKSVSGSIQYRAYQNGAWTNWVSDGQKCGNGENDIQYVEIKLTDKLAEKYDICYKTIVRGGEWYGWTANGGTAGDGSAATDKRVEGLQVQLLKKGAANDLVAFETKPAVSGIGEYIETLSGSAERDNNGNTTQGSYENGAFTLGSTWCYELNSMKLKVENKKTTGDIRYKMYQNGKWTNWVSNGSKCGDGKSKTYLLQIELTGNLAKKYDIYYQTILYGGFWTEWSKNGADSGSVDSSRNVEGVRIKLVKKGTTVDTNVSRSYTVTFKDYNGTVLSTQTVFKGQSAKAPKDPTRTGYTFTGWDKTYSKITGDTVITAQYKKNVSVSSYKFSTEKAFVNTSVKLNVTLASASSDTTCKFIAQGGNYPYGQKDKYFTMDTATSGSWTPDMDGTYRIYVDVTDMGKTTRCYVGDYTVLKIPTVASHKFNTEKAFINSNVNLSVTLDGALSDATCKFIAQGGNYPYGQKDKYFTMNTATSGSWTPDMDGTYRIYVDITEAGRTFRCYIGDYTVLKIPTVASYKFSKNTIEVNSKLTLDVTLADAASDATCKFIAQGGNYPYGQKDKYFTMNTATSGSWTPDMDGTYKIFVDITDAGKTYRKCICSEYKVEKETDESATTIYYKGYTNPKIHYQVGNGSWTSDNGVYMTPCTDVDGFDYAITIDLNGASGITACFNDGYGNWDNNSRQNYKFGAGYYTCKNGTITKIDKPSSELKINSVTSSVGDTMQMGTSTIITINAGGGAGGYKYNLYYSAYGSGRTVYLLKESSENTATFTPDYPRETYLYVDVIDNDGNKVSTQKVLQVNNVTENQITIYYKASKATNIHYQIGNESWTKAPGVEMEVASDKPGYYKKVINLGNATTLKACFNDGSNWDNNDRKDYCFDTPGTYTVENKSITKNN